MATRAPWRVQDELIEQPSWGGRYIIDLKGLSDDPQWQGKKVGQSYELAKASQLIDPVSGDVRPLKELISSDPAGWLGQDVLQNFGPDLSLLIKLTQAKGNSFQVHLPEGKSLGHWQPKPEAWFYLAPGLYTFGLKEGTSFDAYSQILLAIDDQMQRLSDEILAGKRTVEDARGQVKSRIDTLNPFSYINLVEAKTDDIVDLTPGGIHHSWEEDNARFPDGNLVYEVQIDVDDVNCSMRGFDKGKFLDSGKVRPTHVADYLATIEQDPWHNDLSQHIRKPQLISSSSGAVVEAVFRTPYFNLDRLSLAAGSALKQTAAVGLQHLFIHSGAAKFEDALLSQGQSFVVPASYGEYELNATAGTAVILQTYLPTGA